MNECKTVRSMTGYGKASLEQGALLLEVEVKSVNSRFLDLCFKLPRTYLSFETKLRELISARLQRGRVELTVVRTPLRQESCGISLNRALFDAYFQVCQSLAKELKCFDGALKAEFVREILFKRDVISCSDEAQDAQSEQRQLLEVVGQALEGLCEMRMAEGARMHEDLCARLETVQRLRGEIAARQSSSAQALKERLLERVQQLAPEVLVDPASLAGECAVLADRVDVTEELVRLESHLNQFRDALIAPPCGRKLEFVLQEVGREYNTIASKAQDAVVQSLVIEAKCELERMREQVQNIE